MAIRELLADFDIRVNDAQLIDSEQHLDQFEADLAATLAATEATSLDLPALDLDLGTALIGTEVEDVDLPEGHSIDVPVNVDVPDVPDVAVGVDVEQPAPVEVHATSSGIRAELDKVDQQIAAASARVMIEGDASPAVDELSTLMQTSQALDTQLQTIGADMAVGVESRVSEVRAELDSLNSAGGGDSSQLSGLADKAQAARAELSKLKRIDAKNPSIPRLESQLRGVETAAEGAKKDVGGLGDSLKSLGVGIGIGAIATGLTAMTTQALDAADAIGKMASRTGLSNESTQAWVHLAAEAGASGEQFETTVKGLTNNMRIAAHMGKGEMFDAFKSIGVAVDDGNGNLRETEAVLVDVLSVLGPMADGAKRAGLAQKLMSEGGMRMLPAFEAGGEAALAQIEHLKALGPYSSEFIENAEAANDAFHELGMSLKSSFVLGALLPMITSVTKALTEFSQHLRTPQGRIQSMTGLVLVATAAFTSLGPAMGIAGGGLAKLIAMGGGLKNIVRMAAGMAIAFLVWEDIIVFLNGGESALGKIIDGMFGVGASAEVLEGVHLAWDGILGVLNAVWNVLSGEDPMVGMSASHIAGAQAIIQTWENFAFFFGSMWDVAKSTALTAIADIVRGLGDLLAGIPLIGSSIQGALGGLADLVGPSSDTLDAADAALSGFGAGGESDGPTYKQLPFFDAPSIAAPAGTGAMNVDNSPHIEVNVSTTGQVSSGQLAQTVAAAATRSLDRSNQAVLRQAGGSL